MKHADALVVVIDEREVIDTLQDEMTRVVKHAAPTMSLELLEETLEGHAVVQVFTRVDFVTQVDAGFVEALQNGSPTPCQFGESFFDQTGRPLWPWIGHWPKQRARESCVGREVKSR